MLCPVLWYSCLLIMILPMKPASKTPLPLREKSYCAAMFHTDMSGKQTSKHWPVPCFIKTFNKLWVRKSCCQVTALNHKEIRRAQNIARRTATGKKALNCLVGFFSFLPCHQAQGLFFLNQQVFGFVFFQARCNWKWHCKHDRKGFWNPAIPWCIYLNLTHRVCEEGR